MPSKLYLAVKNLNIEKTGKSDKINTQTNRILRIVGGLRHV